MSVTDRIDKLQAIFSGEERKRRIQKAIRILALFKVRRYCPAEMSCLEIGTGSGVMAEVFADGFGDFSSVDIQDLRLKKEAEYNFELADSTKLPFEDGSFDVVIYTQVHQYIEYGKKRAALEEIRRTLKPNGVCYFTSSNKYALIEPHFNLPLLGFLPQPLANLYLKLFTAAKYSKYEIYSENYSRLLGELGKTFEVEDLTLYFIRNHKLFSFEDVPSLRLISKIPDYILILLIKTIFPNWIVWLQKNEI